MKPTLDADGRLIPRVRLPHILSELWRGGFCRCLYALQSPLRQEPETGGRERATTTSSALTHGTAPDNGLTVDRAQELGEKFCAEHFPGHQALVCTHPDGHNHSGNIHVHIVINSLRIAEVPMLPHMDRPADTRKQAASTAVRTQLWNYLKAEVMEMCHSEGLYQIDLLNGSKEPHYRA